MSPKRCKTCGGTDGAHYAFCFGARIFERVMGKGYPLFPPGAFIPAPHPKAIAKAVRRVIDADGTLGEAQQAAREAGGRLEVTLEAEPGEHLAALREVAALSEQIDAEHRAALRYRDEAETEREARERAERERDELRALLDAATQPEPDEEFVEDETPAEEPAAFERTPEPEPHWWNTPLGREARASVALDGETHVVGEPHVVEPMGEATPGQLPGDLAALREELAEEPMPTLEQLASVPDAEPTPEPVPAAGLDEAEVEALEEAVAGLEAAQEPAEIEEIEASFTEAARRKAWMDEKRAELRQTINATEGLTQKAIADGTGLNQGSVSAILNGKVYGPTSESQLQRMLQVAENFVNPPKVTVEPEPPAPRGGAPAQVKNSDSWRAAERFLAEAVEKAETEDAFVTAPELQAAYEAWRATNDAATVHPMTLGQVTVASGFARVRKQVGGKQQRAYGGMRLRELAVARQGGGDEAPQDSDGEPNAVAPATFQGPEYVHGEPERYTRDNMSELIAEAREARGHSPLAEFIASERPMGAGMVPFTAGGDPARFLRDTAPAVKVVEHPPGWDELPGKELANPEMRAMALLLRKEQGWGYKKSNGRSGKPKLRNPEGHIYTLSNVPKDIRSVKNTRAALRRLGAKL